MNTKPLGTFDGFRRHLSPNLREAVVADLVVLLDLREGEYTILDSLAALVWRYLLEPSVANEQALREQSGLSGPELAMEVEDFMSVCEQRGFLDRMPRAEVAQSARARGQFRTSAFSAWRLLVSTQRRIRAGAFPQVYAETRAAHRPVPGDEPRVPLEQAVRDFRLAENFFLNRKGIRDCLPRSLALYRHLTACGHRVEHHIGVQLYPFAAHAWVTQAGAPILDLNQFIDKFAPIARIGDD